MNSSSILWNGAVAAIILVVAKFAINKVLSIRQGFISIRHLPGQYLLWIDPFFSLALFLAPVFPRPSQIGHYRGKFTLYAKAGSTCVSSVRLWTSQPYFWFADADAIKSICADRYTFQKDVQAYETLNIYGENLLGTENDEAKRHRAVSKPSFNEANSAVVWTETLRVVADWFDELDRTHHDTIAREGIVIDVVEAMVQATLLVISAAGFGRRISWQDDSASEPLPGHNLSFRTAITATIENLFVKVLTPNWLYNIASVVHIPLISVRLTRTREVFEELRLYLVEMISSTRASIVEGKSTSTGAALLKNLVQANLSQEDDFKCLTDDELLSNMFVFLLAGHETSAHSLSFTMALLALYPDVQKKMHEEAVSLWPEGFSVNSTYKDFSKLEYTLAVFRETLRLFPSEPRLIKLVRADATVTATRFTPNDKDPSMHGEIQKYLVPMPAGSNVALDIWAVHMNPIYWGPDVDEFKPERFIDAGDYRWPRDAFLPFSAGPRGCIGQRFALTESVCILASLVRHYEIRLPRELMIKTFEEQKEILLQWTTGITMTPTNVRVRLRRRSL